MSNNTAQLLLDEQPMARPLVKRPIVITVLAVIGLVRSAFWLLSTLPVWLSGSFSSFNQSLTVLFAVPLLLNLFLYVELLRMRKTAWVLLGIQLFYLVYFIFAYSSYLFTNGIFSLAFPFLCLIAIGYYHNRFRGWF